MLDRLDATLADIVQKMADLSAQYGPDAGELLLATVRFHGASTLAIGFAALFLSLCLLAVAAYALRRTKPYADNGWELAVIGCGVAGGGALLVSLAHLLDRWAWAAAIDPRLYLAHELLQKIGL